MRRHRAFSHSGGFRRTKSGFRQNRFHSNHWFNQATFNVTNGTSFPTTPVILDTFVLDSNRVAVGGALIKDVRVARIIWSSALYAPTEAIVSTSAFMSAMQALYIDGLTASGGSAHAGQAFMTISEFNNTAVGWNWPERIIWKRLSAIPVGNQGAAPSGVQAPNYSECGPVELNPVTLTPRVRLDQDQALIHRVEMANPTTTTIQVTVQSMGTFVIETRL